MTKNPQFEIVFTQSMFDQLHRHLLAKRGLEQAALVLAAPNVSPGTLRLLVHEIIYLSPSDFEHQSGIFLSIKPARSKEILRRCLDEGWSLIEIHSHPFSDGTVSFSNIDIDNEKQKFTYVADKIPDIYHATMVFGQNSLDAHVYDREYHVARNIERIRIIGDSHRLIFPVSATQAPTSNIDMDRFDRQVGAFGAAGQNALAQIRAGIVGLGGIGSHLAQQLAHLGVRDFVLIDHDHVEVSNLNRLVGANQKDANRKTFKVDVAKRLIRRINPGTQVEACRLNIAEPEAALALKGVDFIFGAADNDGCRLLLNRIAVQFLIPYLDLGTGIETHNGEITALGGQIRFVLPGHGFCLNCTNTIDRVQAGIELRTPEQSHMLQSFGYGLGPQYSAPAVIFLNGSLASLAVGEFFNYFTGYKRPSGYSLLDLRKPSLITVQTERQIDCITCSTESFLARGDLEPFPKNVGAMKIPLPRKR